MLLETNFSSLANPTVFIAQSTHRHCLFPQEMTFDENFFCFAEFDFYIFFRTLVLRGRGGEGGLYVKSLICETNVQEKHKKLEK